MPPVNAGPPVTAVDVPSQARLSTFAVSEVAGAVLAWFPPRALGTGPPPPDDGLPTPAWELSEPANDGWTAVKWKSGTFAGHPLETTENSVDVGHLGFLHGYHDVVALGPARAEGHVLRARYQMTRKGKGLSAVLPAMRTEFDVVVEGLGFSRVELTVHTIGARLRLFVLPTPVGRGQVQVLLGVSAQVGPWRRRRRCSLTCRPASWPAPSEPSPCPTSTPMCARTAAYGPPSATCPIRC